MRLPRLILLLLCFVALSVVFTSFSLLSAHPRRQSSNSATDSRAARGIRALFSFNTPLFPPSAIISLTDDNSTFFLARPAAFGPLLPSKGLSGPLWVGSGFGDDSLRRGGIIAGSEGELGCSDVPGWGELDKAGAGGTSGSKGSLKKVSTSKKQAEKGERKNEKAKRSVEGNIEKGQDSAVTSGPHEDDGTDDYLHHPLPGSDISNSERHGHDLSNSAPNKGAKSPAHADIQSLQESAEIAGKVVLLSRGGCGFLEKVKWVQRRGGIALIVGDDTRGGGLVTMYARGDTSNVSIPALFTSHTTAHLLSSLIPPGFADEKAVKSATVKAKADLKSNPTTDKAMRQKAGPTSDHSPQTPADTKKKASSSKKITRRAALKSSNPTKDPNAAENNERPGWIRSFFLMFGIGSSKQSRSSGEDSRRPPSSGHLHWVPSEALDEINEESSGSKKAGSAKGKSDKGSTKAPGDVYSKPASGDGFVIGVQDWRDPDLIESSSGSEHQSTSSQSKPKSNAPGSSNGGTDASRSGKGYKGQQEERLKGGSITPGSGEYAEPGQEVGNNAPSRKPMDISNENNAEAEAEVEDEGDGSLFRWISRLSWADEYEEDEDTSNEKPKGEGASNIHIDTDGLKGSPSTKAAKLDGSGNADESGDHEGLWVTLSPASMSTSPLFDTLLVLVVSPLVTLTVVYTLLLLRSQIRRRRWRAPKAVVERLPVRTYHTVPSISSSSGSSSSSSSSSLSIGPPANPSAASPLLQGGPRPDSRPHPRTPAAHSAQGSASGHGPSSSVAGQEHEKENSGLAKWRKKYTGRQVECVVCLEEYIDGVSRVMSLPCGHEFHAECITPWLTTRRRTCPICKGDVVRSMAQGSSSPIRTPYQDVQTRAAETRNDSPSSALPITEDVEDEADPERADESAAQTTNERQSHVANFWRAFPSLRAWTSSDERSVTEEESDRDR
ncbi:hypothetical protein L228DRAFT_263989 [Xylona heveae TC161]|uniref:RING-type E3 ubiquitin transferase n=1 Tax=Xylona heveae (strain CBS 132557 / TC161) TaxID=1328760 RepID=A0A164ZL51_XYLHT|nr:hypothetical protein L228DRAFT_263989 [Xylona heveae TC161]KZF19232.1 hypothetical protein L228DRAFT_263989 [Xylona heveae TC161]